MRFAVEAFGITADVLSCHDPWGLGMSFRIHRFGSRRHRQFHKRRLSKDPLSQKAYAKLFKRGLAFAKKERDEKATPKPAVEVLPPETASTAPATEAAAPPPTVGEELQECMIEALEEEVEAGRFNIFDLLSTRDRELAEVVALLDGWSGVNDETGSPVEFSEDAATALFDCDTVVAEGQPFAGKTIGDALIEHLLAFAKDHNAARQQYLEAGEKNSAGSSAGT